MFQWFKNLNKLNKKFRVRYLGAWSIRKVFVFNHSYDPLNGMFILMNNRMRVEYYAELYIIDQTNNNYV